MTMSVSTITVVVLSAFRYQLHLLTPPTCRRHRPSPLVEATCHDNLRTCTYDHAPMDEDNTKTGNSGIALDAHRPTDEPPYDIRDNTTASDTDKHKLKPV